jgi:hypothetical protein
MAKAEIVTSSEPQSMVTIIVRGGAQSKRFTIHKETLCYYSPVFDKSFNGYFVEGEAQTMTLEDVEASIFGLLVCWLYHGEIASREFEGHDDSVKYHQTPL